MCAGKNLLSVLKIDREKDKNVQQSTHAMAPMSLDCPFLVNLVCTHKIVSV